MPGDGVEPPTLRFSVALSIGLFLHRTANNRFKNCARFVLHQMSAKRPLRTSSVVARPTKSRRRRSIQRHASRKPSKPPSRQNEATTAPFRPHPQLIGVGRNFRVRSSLYGSTSARHIRRYVMGASLPGDPRPSSENCLCTITGRNCGLTGGLNRSPRLKPVKPICGIASLKLSGSSANPIRC